MTRHSLQVALALLSIQLPLLVFACEPAESLAFGTYEEFRSSERAATLVEPDALDHPLLAEAIFHETNRRRDLNGAGLLGHEPALDRAACVHAQAMVEGDFFAHLNPNDPELATPADRLRDQGLEIGFVAENIGETFLLDYQSGEQVYVREEEGGTVFSREPGGEPLEERSYLQVAESLLDGWMASEGHRRNVLSPRPDFLGAGCGSLVDEELDMPMLSCVQLFFAPLR